MGQSKIEGDLMEQNKIEGDFTEQNKIEGDFTKQNKIDTIIQLEWAFFDQVQNIGGRAECQDDFHTFEIMRKSQFLCWSDALLDSYCYDLLSYQEHQGNPIALKYAYMMQYTSPEEYALIASQLPSVSEATLQLIQKITDVQTQWSEEFYSTHPNLMMRSRPPRSAQDSIYEVSSETYLRCELYTYSERTLRLYEEHLQHLQAEHKNLVEMVFECTAKLYGYASAEEAEQAHS